MTILLLGTQTAQSAKPNATPATPPNAVSFQGERRVLDVTTLGANGEDGLDDSGPIQKALDYLSEHGGGVVYFPPGSYLTSKTLYIRGPRYVGTSLQGAGMHKTKITYIGKKCVPVVEALPDAYGGVRLTDLTIQGGRGEVRDDTGMAKYCFYAPSFHRGSEIARCTFRNALGLIRIERGWLSNGVHDSVFRGTTRNRSKMSITHKQWLEVHGPQSAPVYLRGMNSCNLNNNSFFSLGSESNGVHTRYAVWIQGSTGTMDNANFELIGRPGLMPAVQTVLRLNWGGTAAGWHVEHNRATRALMETLDLAPQRFRKMKCYAQGVPTVFLHSGRGDLWIEDCIFMTVFAPTLFQGVHPHATIRSDNCMFRPGQWYKDPSVSDRKHNVLSTAGGLHDQEAAQGTADTPDGPAISERLRFPEIVEGYRVQTGRDRVVGKWKLGPAKGKRGNLFIQVESGRLIREDGKSVCTPFGVLGNQASGGGRMVDQENGKIDYEKFEDGRQVVRLRPTEADRWYRVFVGVAGQAFLKVYKDRPNDPSGNWLADVFVDAEGMNGTVHANPRLAMRGEYPGGGKRCRALVEAPPKQGYWLRGDRIVCVDPKPGEPAEWMCVREGYAPQDARFVPVAAAAIK